MKNSKYFEIISTLAKLTADDLGYPVYPPEYHYKRLKSTCALLEEVIRKYEASGISISINDFTYSVIIKLKLNYIEITDADPVFLNFIRAADKISFCTDKNLADFILTLEIPYSK